MNTRKWLQSMNPGQRRMVYANMIAFRTWASRIKKSAVRVTIRYDHEARAVYFNGYQKGTPVMFPQGSYYGWMNGKIPILVHAVISRRLFFER